MHYCLLLITKEMPSENRISEILKPYDEEIFIKFVLVWYFYVSYKCPDGGRR